MSAVTKTWINYNTELKSISIIFNLFVLIGLLIFCFQIVCFYFDLWLQLSTKNNQQHYSICINEGIFPADNPWCWIVGALLIYNFLLASFCSWKHTCLKESDWNQFFMIWEEFSWNVSDTRLYSTQKFIGAI